MVFFARLMLSAVCIVLALVPTWFFLVARSLLSPEGFWQEVFVFGVGLYFLGGLQIFLAIALLFVLAAIWTVKID